MRIINENAIGQILLHRLHDLPALIPLVESRGGPVLKVALEGVSLKLALFLGELLILLMRAQLPLCAVHLVVMLLEAFMRDARPVAVLPSLGALRELQVLLPGRAKLVAMKILLLSSQPPLLRNIF